MNNKINKLNKKLNKKLNDVRMDAAAVEMQLQIEYNKVFEKMPLLGVVSKLEDSRDFIGDEYGEIHSWIRFDFSDFQECKQYLIEYMRETYHVECDFENDCMTLGQGESIIIQDDTLRDNGVYLNGKRIIEEHRYKTDGEVDVTLRNIMIEDFMEKTGFYPGVFRVTYRGDVFSVNTKQ